MKVVASYSIKGGVGKTTAAVNLAFAAASAGVSTLVWDLDPQGAATYSFRVKPKVKGGVERLVSGKRELDGAIKGTDFERLDLLPADFTYRHLDLVLDSMKKPTRRLAKLLRGVADEYQWAMLDCPPSISLASEGVIEAADVLLVPIVPAPLSLRTLEQLDGFVRKTDATAMVLPFLSMVDRRKRLHLDVIDELRARRPDLLRTEIPALAEIERMTVRREPLAVYSPHSAAAAAFASLWAEVRDRTEGAPAARELDR